LCAGMVSSKALVNLAGIGEIKWFGGMNRPGF